MASAAAARGTRERYLQWFKPTRAYRFRRAVPAHLRSIIGQSEWTETLSRDLAEAKRQLRVHIERTDRILALAEAGNWPEVTLLHGSASGRSDPMPSWSHAMRT
jgi:hypothetical protein